jgi:hypothetical protein
VGERACLANGHAGAAALPRVSTVGGWCMPAHMPRSGRRSSATVPASVQTSDVQRSMRRGAAIRGAGIVAWEPSRRAEHAPASGQDPQRGAAGVHTVAPSSMSASLRTAGDPAAATSRAASAHAHRSDAGSATRAGAAATRASTRRTLPSTIGTRSPKAMLAIAPAVYRPTPGRARRSDSVRGTAPP